MNKIRLDGKVALVTGGAKGIGYGISTKLAELGAKVVVNGNYRESGHGPEDDVVAEIRANGGEAVAVNGSVYDDSAARAMIEAALDNWGQLDIVINNAGNATHNDLIQNAPDDTLAQQIDVHVRGTMMVVRAAWPHLIKSGQGRVLNTSSACAWGFEGPHGWNASYATAKAALFGTTRQMAGAGRPHGIGVNMLFPRALTPLVAEHIGGTPLHEWQLKHLEMDPLTNTVAYLVHPECKASGQFFTSAGGRVARVVIASPEGYWNPKLSPEDVRDNWDQVWGKQDADGFMDQVFELTDQEREHQFLVKLFG